MKISTLLLSAVLAFCLSAAAQTPGKTKIKGCLQSGAESNSFTLSNSGGSYRLMPMSGVNLRSEIGNEVEVAGILTKGEEVSGLQSPIDPGKGSLSRPDKALQSPFTSKDKSREDWKGEIKVSSIRHISKGCR